jgi:hypothetical protein
MAKKGPDGPHVTDKMSEGFQNGKGLVTGFTDLGSKLFGGSPSVAPQTAGPTFNGTPIVGPGGPAAPAGPTFDANAAGTGWNAASDAPAADPTGGRGGGTAMGVAIPITANQNQQQINAATSNMGPQILAPVTAAPVEG